MIIDHNHPGYLEIRNKSKKGKNNGCWYYSNEIVDNIIPNVKTWRGWNTVGRELDGMEDHMIVFLHDNAYPWNYDWLKNYKDLVLVCSSKYTRDSVIYFGHTILLPMSVDTEYVKKFRTKKTKDTCFVGNEWVKDNTSTKIPKDVVYLRNMPREKLLAELAKFRNAFCIDRCAIEAAVLGCNLLEIETAYSCDNVGSILDNRDAAKILQKELDKLDKGGK